ncbi:MAG: rRNA pseudouridine synthase [Epsilonproteobacteria bacterium]|nr:rRNA pseudouridine synthase [Campylobacterota bacterium]
MRLNKFISHNTPYSRREADELIKNGLVKVGHKVVTDFSYDVKDGDKVFIKGRYVKRKRGELTVIAFNKPKGVLVTKRDDRGRTTIYHILPGRFRRFIPVGRLDFASEGLLLLTDSPKVADLLMRSKLPRVYNIKIDKPLSQEMIDAMKNGLKLEDATAGAHKESKIKEMEFAPFDNFEIRKAGKNFTKLRVTISEGKNRELRRFFGHFGAKVLDLKRVAFGWVELNNLPTGKVRFLTSKEYDKLHKFIKEEAKKNDRDKNSKAK